MGYTAPSDASNGQLIGPTDWNILVDDIVDLHRRTVPVANSVDTAQTTTSTTPADLATVGPSATVTIGASGVAVVILTCDIGNSLANGVGVMGYNISGASTFTASDQQSLALTSWTANARNRASFIFVNTGLNPGSTTFTAKYWVNANTGTFQHRHICVIPMSS